MSEDEVLAARRLHATEYLRAGYVSESDVGADGTLLDSADPWVPFSRYYGAFDDDGILRATSRVISAEAPWPLPTLQLPTFDPEVRRTLEALPAERLGEISALARCPEVGAEYPRAVFRALWLDVLERGVEALVLCVDVLVLRTLRAMDHDVFRVVGGPAPAPVRPVLPVWLRPAEMREEMYTNCLPPSEIVLP